MPSGSIVHSRNVTCDGFDCVEPLMDRLVTINCTQGHLGHESIVQVPAMDGESPEKPLVGIQPLSAPAPIGAYMPQDTEVPDLHELVVDSPPTSHVQEALPFIQAAEEIGDPSA